MDVTKELGPMFDAENAYIEAIKAALAEYGESITDKAEHDLRMGYRTAELIDLKLKRHQEARGLAMRPVVVMANAQVVRGDPPPCWHRNINGNGFCVDCGKRAAISLP